MPRDENGKRREATDEERVRVIELHAEGKSYRAIEAETGISKSDMQRIVNLWNTKRLICPPTRPGPKPKLSKRDKRKLIRTSDNHPRATLVEVVNEARLLNPVHSKTAGKYLRRANR